MKTLLHVTLMPIMFFVAASILTAPLRNDAVTAVVMLCSLVGGAAYGWRNSQKHNAESA